MSTPNWLLSLVRITSASKVKVNSKLIVILAVLFWTNRVDEIILALLFFNPFGAEVS